MHLHHKVYYTTIFDKSKQNCKINLGIVIFAITGYNIVYHNNKEIKHAIQYKYIFLIFHNSSNNRVDNGGNSSTSAKT